MTKSKLSFNRNDWSGKTIEVEVEEKDGSFRFDFAGYRFLLEPVTIDEDVADLIESDFALTCLDEVDVSCWLRVNRFQWEGKVDANYSAASCGIERSAPTPVQTAVEVLCNTL